MTIPPRNALIHGDAVDVMRDWTPESVDMMLTSPPYADLRTYKRDIGRGYQFPFADMAAQIYRTLKSGGVLVWVVGDRYQKGETLEPLRQALAFQELGFWVHDTIIWDKGTARPTRSSRHYGQLHEYMFVLSKDGYPKTVNLMREPTKYGGQRVRKASVRGRDDKLTPRKDYTVADTKVKGNVWRFNVGWMKVTPDKMAHRHPAIFPDKLAEAHIASWSNEGDLVVDPMAGSGTVAKMARLAGRDTIGIDLEREYLAIAEERLDKYGLSLPVMEHHGSA